jgi:hypothetical protein
MVISWREWKMMSKSNTILAIILVFTGILVAYMASTSYNADNNSMVDASAVNLPFKGIMHNNNNDRDTKVAQVKLPTYIPAGYHLYDSAYDESIVMLYYIPAWAEDKISEEGISKYLLTFVAEHCLEPAVKEKVDKGEDYFKDYKARSQRGDRIQLFEINGNPAMGWEVGKKNSITMLDDKIINVEEVEYKAGVAMIDKDGCAYYSVGAYLPLEELKKIMASLEKP